MSRDVTPRFKTAKPPPKRRGHNSTLAASKPISQVSERQKSIESDYIEVKRRVHERSKRRCEMVPGHHAPGCEGRAHEIHHVEPRSLGRDDSLDNLRDLSIACHVQAELHPPFYRQLFADNPIGDV